jgi:hypothetical protein
MDNKNSRDSSFSQKWSLRASSWIPLAIICFALGWSYSTVWQKKQYYDLEKQNQNFQLLDQKMQMQNRELSNLGDGIFSIVNLLLTRQEICSNPTVNYEQLYQNNLKLKSQMEMLKDDPSYKYLFSDTIYNQINNVVKKLADQQALLDSLPCSKNVMTDKQWFNSFSNIQNEMKKQINETKTKTAEALKLIVGNDKL